MINFSGTTDFNIDGPAALTLGKFEGVHRGHQILMRRVLQYAADHHAVSAVFSIRPDKEKAILTKKEQMDVIEGLGIAAFVDCPFVPEISTMSAEDFVREIVIGRLNAAYIAVGTDFRFGYRRQGDAAFLKENEKRFGIRVDVIEKETYKGREISSSYVREALLEGDVKLARVLMGRPYSIEGTVLHGAHLGTKLGMPTANLVPDPDKLLPAYGVYVSKTLLDGRTFRGVTNIGTKPTVDGTYEGAETYLFDYGTGTGPEPDAKDLYGKQIRVSLLDRLRPEIKFASLEELKAQIREDIRRGESYYDAENNV